VIMKSILRKIYNIILDILYSNIKIQTYVNSKVGFGKNGFETKDFAIGARFAAKMDIY